MVECVGIRSLTWVGRVGARGSRKVLDNRSGTDLTRGRVRGGTGRLRLVGRGLGFHFHEKRFILIDEA